MRYLLTVFAFIVFAFGNSFCQLHNTIDAQMVLLASRGRAWEVWFNGGRIMLGNDDTNLIGLRGKCSLLNGVFNRINELGVWNLTSVTFVYFDDSYWGWPAFYLASISNRNGMFPFRIANVNSHTFTLMTLSEVTEGQHGTQFRALDVGHYSNISSVAFASKIASKP